MAISISSFSMFSFKQWSRPLKFSSAGNFSKSLMIDPQGLLITELIAISRFLSKTRKMIMKYYHINSHDLHGWWKFWEILDFFYIRVFDAITTNVYNWFVEVAHWTVMVGFLNDKQKISYQPLINVLCKWASTGAWNFSKENWNHTARILKVNCVSIHKSAVSSEWSALQLVKWSRPCLSSRMITQLDLYV